MHKIKNIIYLIYSINQDIRQSHVQGLSDMSNIFSNTRCGMKPIVRVDSRKPLISNTLIFGRFFKKFVGIELMLLPDIFKVLRNVIFLQEINK